MRTFGQGFAILLTALIVTGCGGGDSETPETAEAASKDQTIVFLPQYWYRWTGHVVPSDFDATTRTATLTNSEADRTSAVAEHPFSIAGKYSVTLNLLDGAATATLIAIDASHDIISFVDQDRAALVPGKPTIIDVSDETASMYVAVPMHGGQTIRVGTVTFTPLPNTEIESDTTDAPPNKNPDTF